jgi:Protein of unknown function (DUF2842)
MTVRLRRLVGVVATVTFLIVYCLIAMAVAGDLLAGQNAAVQLLGYVVFGVAWLPGAMAIIRWMSRPA